MLTNSIMSMQHIQITDGVYHGLKNILYLKYNRSNINRNNYNINRDNNISNNIK